MPMFQSVRLFGAQVCGSDAASQFVNLSGTVPHSGLRRIAAG